MKFSIAAVLGAAAAVQAGHNVSYTTEVVTALTTYCPYATTIENNGVTYTITEATTLTITNCPCTVTKPVTTYSANSTVSVVPTTSVAAVTTAAVTTASAVVTAGAGKAAALSGAGLAGVLGLAAFVL